MSELSHVAGLVPRLVQPEIYCLVDGLGLLIHNIEQSHHKQNLPRDKTTDQPFQVPWEMIFSWQSQIAGSLSFHKPCSHSFFLTRGPGQVTTVGDTNHLQ